MRVSEFDFDLPARLVAQAPVEPRDSARLLVYERAARKCRHRVVRDLPDELQAGDLLVVNDTRVMPWRLRGRRATGGRVEGLILARQGAVCRGLLKPAAKLRVGVPVVMEGGALTLHPEASLGGGLFRFRLVAAAGATLDDALERFGRAPLPPYIARDGSEDVGADRERYQTVFAANPGAVAAPTAGLHFTPTLLGALERRGVAVAPVTLHVGPGTFAPVRVETVEDHVMHSEAYVLPPATAAAVATAQATKGRVVAVGTTAARVLESCAREDGSVEAGTGQTELFLYPGRPLRVVDALMTNFHLPRSTLLMLVSAFAGREPILEAYREAVEQEYRFYSFGDSMLLL